VGFSARSLVVAVVVILSCAAPASASYPGTSNGRIAYTYNGVRTMKSDGTGKVLLDSIGASPTWSPNGKRIAYVRGQDIWTMNADGSNKVRVTTASSNERGPTWSPDGKRIAFWSDRNGHTGIYILNSTKPFGATVPYFVFTNTCCGGSVGLPVWSSKGVLAFAQQTKPASGSDSCEIDKVVSGAEQGIAGGRGCFGFDWGPKANALAIATGYGSDPLDPPSYVSAALESYTLSTATYKYISIPPSGVYRESPAWAPAGTWLLYDQYTLSSGTVTRQGIWKIKGDGTGAVRISATGTDPDWQPIP